MKLGALQNVRDGTVHQDGKSVAVKSAWASCVHSENEFPHDISEQKRWSIVRQCVVIRAESQDSQKWRVSRWLCPNGTSSTSPSPNPISWIPRSVRQRGSYVLDTPVFHWDVVGGTVLVPCSVSGRGILDCHKANKRVCVTLVISTSLTSCCFLEWHFPFFQYFNLI